MREAWRLVILLHAVATDRTEEGNRTRRVVLRLAAASVSRMLLQRAAATKRNAAKRDGTQEREPGSTRSVFCEIICTLLRSLCPYQKT